MFPCHLILGWLQVSSPNFWLQQKCSKLRIISINVIGHRADQDTERITFFPDASNILILFLNFQPPIANILEN
jgi:hypothetical protein